jgi:hypothetical protein
VTDREKMEGSCSTGQSPQRAVVPVEEEEEEEEEEKLYYIFTKISSPNPPLKLMPFTCTFFL